MAGTANQPTGQEIVADARRYLGIPYKFGGGPANPQAGLDCSGLTERVAFDVGINSCPRTSEEQFSWGIPITNAEVGCLVFFVGAPEEAGPPGHVGIVTGPGQMINAPFTGDTVEYDSFSENGVGDNKFMGYRRMQGATGSPASASQGTGNNFIDESAAAAAGGIGGVIGFMLLLVLAAAVIVAVFVVVFFIHG